jgi:hypothetical protein
LQTKARCPRASSPTRLQRLRSTCPSTELDHGFIAVAEGEPRQLGVAPIAIEETDVPPLTEGERHQDFGHGSVSFPWKLGLEGGILPWRQHDETGPNTQQRIPSSNFSPWSALSVCTVQYGLVTQFNDVAAPSATPEPSSLILLGTGVLGAAGLLRRKLPS